MYTVYVLKSMTAKKSYVGMTNDFERRFFEHNAGKSTHTERFIPWELLHKEYFTERAEARKGEVYLKSSAGRKFLRNLF